MCNAHCDRLSIAVCDRHWLQKIAHDNSTYLMTEPRNILALQHGTRMYFKVRSVVMIVEFRSNSQSMTSIPGRKVDLIRTIVLANAMNFEIHPRKVKTRCFMFGLSSWVSKCVACQAVSTDDSTTDFGWRVSWWNSKLVVFETLTANLEESQCASKIFAPETNTTRIARRHKTSSSQVCQFQTECMTALHPSEFMSSNCPNTRPTQRPQEHANFLAMIMSSWSATFWQACQFQLNAWLRCIPVNLCPPTVQTLGQHNGHKNMLVFLPWSWFRGAQFSDSVRL